MSAINITNARKELYNLVENVNRYSEPTLIVSKKGNAVLLSEEDWNAPTRRRANTRLSLVTGEKPVGAYWGEIPFSPPSAVHSAGPLLLPSHHRQLSWRSDVRVLVRVIGLCF